MTGVDASHNPLAQRSSLSANVGPIDPDRLPLAAFSQYMHTIGDAVLVLSEAVAELQGGRAASPDMIEQVARIKANVDGADSDLYEAFRRFDAEERRRGVLWVSISTPTADQRNGHRVSDRLSHVDTSVVALCPALAFLVA